ncbi:MAG: hypothetical protein IBX55_21150 [Methyloprofundus sp.]|nr:hypothetical protein [Methyloprofundus sp.]
MNPNAGFFKRLLTSIITASCFYLLFLAFAASIAGDTPSASILVILSALLFLFNRRFKHHIYCAWCGSHSNKIKESKISNWVWEYRNKDGSQDKRVKSNVKKANFIAYWKCKKCGAITQTTHNASNKPTRRNKIIELKLTEPGTGDRTSNDYFDPDARVVSGENRKNT